MEDQNQEHTEHPNLPRCEVCGSEDDVLHISQVIGNRQQEIDICESCAALLGIERVDSSITPRVSDLFAAVLDPTGVGPKDNSVCPRCGTSFASIRRSGRAGCSTCYEVFRQEIDELLHRSGNRIAHRGKVPLSLQQVRNLLVEKPELEELLQMALVREDYEEAARLSAEIKGLENVSNQGQEPNIVPREEWEGGTTDDFGEDGAHA